MKEIIQDIRKKLLSNAYKKEEHVRVAIIARICQALGWDIWNPEEFYPEFPIKLKNKEGSVDVVLFHSQLKEKTPDVFFELKSVGKLRGNIESSEDQLQEYNYYNAASITVLTDGRQWRFYLSSAPGTFSQRLFCSFDLSEDAEEYVISVLMNVLSKNRFVKDAVNTAQSMLLDLKLSREIGRAKSEADSRSNRYPNLNKYQLVQAIMTERGHNVSIEEIIRLWDKTIAGGDPCSPPPPPVPPPPTGVRTDHLEDYSYKEVKYIEINHNPRIELKKWTDVKKHVYIYLIKNFPDLKLTGILRY